jgi:hypothetical protein
LDNIGITADNDMEQTGHYVHHIKQDSNLISDFRTCDPESGDAFLATLPDGGSFRVWARPESFWPDGFPVWNGMWDVICDGTFRNSRATRQCRIELVNDDLSCVLIADRRLTMIADPEVETVIDGAFWCNGESFIGNSVRVHSESGPSRSIGTLHLSGYIKGDLDTSSVLFNTFFPNPMVNSTIPSDFVSGSVHLLSGYTTFHPRQKVNGEFVKWYRLATVARQTTPGNTTPLPLFSRCFDSKGFPSYGYCNAVNRVQCVEGYKGLWQDPALISGRSAIAAPVPGLLPEQDHTLSLGIMNPLNIPIASFEKGNPIMKERPDGNVLFRQALPDLDWRHLHNLASETSEKQRDSAQGTVFKNWDEFSAYINDDKHDLVHHFRDQNSRRITKIAVGNFDDSGQPGPPVVFYIRMNDGDKELPDMGCFGVFSPNADLEINGSLICEASLDLRDLDAADSGSGRWREYTTGRDGCVIPFCGGLPLIHATDSNSCDHFEMYRWCRDGAADVSILGYPQLPAIASLGNVWIVNRIYQTVINGPIYAPEGQIFISNPPLNNQQAAVSVTGYLMGRDIDLTGPISIESDTSYASSAFFRKLDTEQVRIVSWTGFF